MQDKKSRYVFLSVTGKETANGRDACFGFTKKESFKDRKDREKGRKNVFMH